MSGSIMTILFVLPVVLLSMLLPLALVVALQVWLCRKGKWLGLILPAITLAMSLMICLSVVGFSAVTGGGAVQVTDGHGNIVEEYHREEEHHQLQPADLAMVGGVFLVFNVPTLVLGGIWLYYKNRPGVEGRPEENEYPGSGVKGGASRGGTPLLRGSRLKSVPKHDNITQ